MFQAMANPEVTELTLGWCVEYLRYAHMCAIPGRLWGAESKAWAQPLGWLKWEIQQQQRPVLLLCCRRDRTECPSLSHAQLPCQGAGPAAHLMAVHLSRAEGLGAGRPPYLQGQSQLQSLQVLCSDQQYHKASCDASAWQTQAGSNLSAHSFINVSDGHANTWVEARQSLEQTSVACRLKSQLRVLLGWLGRGYTETQLSHMCSY